ncbi:ATP-binding protein [Runella salmonicolor]|uniref:histidine kinase n=1 Tax=Runella salmonicolor TaxID=2950278 RepID=A0ABT1FI95_9BACT|nr:ATP-binding protein [Runella salmonicolor]MCP1381230.1 ATP-binding protein [Runella salmonicolor]
MKRQLLLLLLWASPQFIIMGQNARIDSLRRILAKSPKDTGYVMTMTRLAVIYTAHSSDSSMKFAQQSLLLARQLGFAKGESSALGALGNITRLNGDLPQALDYSFKALTLAQTLNDPVQVGWQLNQVGVIYLDLGEKRKALHYFQQAKKYFEESGFKTGMAQALSNMTNTYISLHLIDSAKIVNQQVQQLNKLTPLPIISQISQLNRSAQIAFLDKHYPEALRLYKQALTMALSEKDIRRASSAQLSIAELFDQIQQVDSAFYYAQLGLVNSRQLDLKVNYLRAANLLTRLYKSENKLDSAFYYQSIAKAINDSLYGPDKFRQLQLFVLSEQQKQQDLINEHKENQNRVRFYTVLAGLTVVLFLAFILWRNNKQQKKANHLLHRQKEEINLQRDKAEKALTDLRSTQSQLIQKEKLASLGELTAGIAHEIQNPLNFVNNFSELSVDLAQELKEEVEKRDIDKELVSDLVGDLVQNQEKINLHGKRASSIVKGMLEHSRQSTGERTLTDINQLADEYLRLAYHGFRAKDKDGSVTRFNSDYELIRDEGLPRIEVVAQEIGRVLLNLINNAFYAVNERAKKGEADYQPKVTVTTNVAENWVEIRVSDNGIGMSEATKSKIFQPFFTTKPTGEGTGLGLSLAYDIVTKGHGGMIEVESKEGEGTTFIMRLPNL